jgi:dolichol-phosphate mannosyltransferase
MKNKNGKLSIILLSYFSGERLNTVHDRLKELFDKEHIPFELIIMDDGSGDNSFDIAQKIESRYPNVFAYQLSRNYTSDYSIFAGLSKCTGSCAVAIPDDEQLPYEIVTEMYMKWNEGNNVIIPHRMSRDDDFISVWFSQRFYSIINKLSEIAYPVGGADSFLIDREIIDIINGRIKPINTAIVPEILRLGFNPLYLPYSRPKSINRKSRWKFKKKLKLALDTFFSSSSFPIKFISYLGLFFSIISFILILLYAYIKIFGNESFWGYKPQGWTSIILIISFFSGVILLSLGIIAEYIWRIYEEVKNRPGYLIKNKVINTKNEN